MKKLLITLLCIILNSCNGQDNKKDETKREEIKQEKETTMEKFNIDNFNKHQENNEWNYIDKDGNAVREIKDESIVFENNEYTTKTKMYGYTVEIKPSKNIFHINKNFHPNGVLKLTGVSFHNGFLKGIWKEYNEKGELIKETDYDIPYIKYPWEKVEKFLKGKNVDLMSPFTSVFRELNSEKIPVWILAWDTGKKNESMFQIIENVEINVETGKIIKEYQSFREP